VLWTYQLTDLLTPTDLGADDKEDMVVVRMGDMRPMIPYQTSFAIAQAVRVGCKEAARFDRAPANFWREMAMDDPRLDTLRPNREFRRSKLNSNVDSWEVVVSLPLVRLLFNGEGKDFDYESGIKFSIAIRRAGHRAKAWAGDSSKTRRMLGALHSAEENYRLGV
jgi:hypothetical protein